MRTVIYIVALILGYLNPGSLANPGLSIPGSSPYPTNPYPNGFQVPGTGPNGSANTLQDVWNASQGMWGVNTNGGWAPIFQSSLGAPAGVSGGQAGQITGGSADSGFTYSSASDPYSWVGQNPGGGNTQIGYTLDPTTGYYIPGSMRSETNPGAFQPLDALPALGGALMGGAIAGGAFGGVGGAGTAAGTGATVSGAGDAMAGLAGTGATVSGAGDAAAAAGGGLASGGSALGGIGSAAGSLGGAGGLAGNLGNLISAGGAIAGLAGGGAGTVPAGGAKTYQPTGSASVDQAWQALMQQMGGATGNLASTANPALMQSFQNAMGINYQPYQQAANAAGQQYAGLSNAALGTGQQQQQAGQQILNTSMDPQSALYNQTLGQTMDTENAQQAMRGLGNSPVGAAEAGQVASNFNIDWQNQQLQRQIAGGQAGSGLLGTGLSTMAQAPGYALQSGQVPLTAQQNVAAAPGNAANAYKSGVGQMLSPLINQQQGMSQYLNQGVGAAANANTTAAGQQTFNASQQQAQMQALMTALNGSGGSGGSSGLGSWLQSMFGGGG